MVYKSSSIAGGGGGNTPSGVTTINGESGDVVLSSTGGTVLITTPSATSINLEVSGGSAVSFTSITGGTNIAAAMVVGTGASLATSGSGTITATSAPANGITGILPVLHGGSGTSTAFTAGSVIFAGASGVYSQDNSNLFWDDPNNRLGIGTATPAQRLEVNGNMLFTTDGNAFLSTAGTTYFSPQTSLTDSDETLSIKPLGTGTNSQIFSYGQASAATGTRGEFDQSGANTIIRNQTLGGGSQGYISFEQDGSTRLRIDTAGNIGVGTASPSAAYGRAIEIHGPADNAALVLSGTTGNIALQYDSGNFYNDISTAHDFIWRSGAAGAYTERARLNSTGLTIGIVGGATGAVLFKGTTSGVVTLSSADSAGTWTMKLPTNAGSNTNVLQTDGFGNTSWVAAAAGTVTSVSGTTNRITSTGGITPVIDISASYIGQSSITLVGALTTGSLSTGFTAVNPAQGGTGQSSLTAHSVLLGEGASAVSFATTGIAARLLIDQGSADPAFKVVSGDISAISTGAFTVLQVNSVAYPASPSTNTVPVVTGSNQITYEKVPNAALSSSAITIGAQTGLAGGGSVALGSAITLSMGTSAANTLAGYNSSGVFANVSIGSNLSLSGGTLNGTVGPAAVTSVFSRTGAVVAVAGDYGFSLISGTAAVSQGGTGAVSFIAHSVLLGEGTAAVSAATTGTSGRLLIDQGNADPSFNAASGDWTITNTGVNTVSKVNSVAYPAAPATNTVPVVTSSNTITYETVPNAALLNSAITIGAQTGLAGGGSVALGSAITLSMGTSAANTLAGYNSSGVFSDISIGTNLSLVSNILNTTSSVVTLSDTQTLTTKRITKRVLALSANSGLPAINTDSYDVAHITSQTSAISSFTTNLTGTPVDGDTLRISVTGTASIGLTFGNSFESSTVTLPSTTSTTSRLDMGFFWNSESTKWRIVAQA